MLEALVILVVVFGLFVVLPLLLLKALFSFVVWLILVPFKLLGVLLKVAGGLFAVVGKVLLGAIGLLAAVLGVALFAVFLPLLPFLVAGFVIYLVIKALQPAPVPVPVRVRSA